MSVNRGQVISFYSFKGGVGRTAALASVAHVLAGNYREDGAKNRVLVIDWDLESPGLHYYLHTEGMAEDQNGLLQLLLDLKLPDSIPTANPVEEQVAALQENIQQLDLKNYFHRVYESVDGPNLWFMPHSGGSVDRYLNDVHRVKWAAIDGTAPWAIPLVIQTLSFEFDYILIDSRTGVADTSLICAQVPDKLVFVFNTNRQSLRGSRLYFDRVMAIRQKNYDLGHGESLQVFPLLSLVQEGMPSEVHNWIKNRTYGAEPFLDEMFPVPETELSWATYLASYHVPYIASLSFGEQTCVMLGDDGEFNAAADCFRRFAELISNDSFGSSGIADTATRNREVGSQNPIVNLSEAARYLESIVSSVDTVRRIGQKNVTDIRTITSAMASEEELAEGLVNIGKYYSQVLDIASTPKDRWASLWLKYAKQIIEDSQTEIRELASGQLPNRLGYMEQGFWSTELWARAEKGIWTTNVAGVGQSFGRQLDKSSIATQGETVNRGVPVTRVFVIESNEEQADLDALAKIIVAQLHVGIDALIISRRTFDDSIENVVDEFGSDDFMIVDDRFIYVTLRTGRTTSTRVKSHSRPIRLLDSQHQLQIARTLRRSIEASATSIERDSTVEHVLALLKGVR